MKYSYSTDGEQFYGDCDTREEAIEEALAACWDGEDIYIGEATKQTIGEYLNNYHIGSLLDSMAESAGEDCGEAAEGWLDKVPKEDLANLKGQLMAVLEAWATQSGYQPTFWHVENVEQVKSLRGEVTE